jgi:hypothetical protein
MAKVQVLGTGCSKCGYLSKNAQAAATERQAGDVVEKIDDIMQVLEFNPSALPALVIDRKFVSAGMLASSVPRPATKTTATVLFVHSRQHNPILASALQPTQAFNIDPNQPHDVGLFIAHRNQDRARLTQTRRHRDWMPANRNDCNSSWNCGRIDQRCPAASVK